MAPLFSDKFISYAGNAKVPSTSSKKKPCPSLTVTPCAESSSVENEDIAETVSTGGRKESNYAIGLKYDAARRSREKVKMMKKKSSISAPNSRSASHSRSSAVPSIYSVGSMDSDKYRSHDVITPLDW